MIGVSFINTVNSNEISVYATLPTNKNSTVYCLLDSAHTFMRPAFVHGDMTKETADSLWNYVTAYSFLEVTVTEAAPF